MRVPTWILAGSLIVAACGGGANPVAPPPPPPPPPPPAPVASVTVTAPPGALVPLQTAQLTASPKDASGNPLSGRAVTWNSSTPGVATIDGNGLVTAVAPGSSEVTATPTPVNGGLRFATLSAGTYHTCGITTLSASWCWGDNSYGPLGDGSQTRRLTPAQVLVPPGVTFVAVSAGNRRTCARTAAGEAYCWGNDTDGNLARGVAPRVPLPTAVVTALRFRVSQVP